MCSGAWHVLCTCMRKRRSPQGLTWCRHLGALLGGAGLGVELPNLPPPRSRWCCTCRDPSTPAIFSLHSFFYPRERDESKETKKKTKNPVIAMSANHVLVLITTKLLLSVLPLSFRVSQGFCCEKLHPRFIE